jgi:ribosomal protein L40E
MQALRELISRVRAWRMWSALRRRPVTPAAASPHFVTQNRPILREVSAQGVRVYSLCGSCGAHMSASATLCEACARTRSRPAKNG